MNKIVLDKERIVNLNIQENSICNIDKSYDISEINIVLNDNVEFIINQYSEGILNDLNINIIENNNSNFIYNHSFRNNDKYNLNINVELIGNNSKNTININGVSDNGNSKIKVDGNVSKSTIDNELYENIRLLNINNGVSYIYPNMFIDTKNVVANHAASISSINDDYLFYLSTRGIDELVSKKLIIDGFLSNDAKSEMEVKYE